MSAGVDSTSLTHLLDLEQPLTSFQHGPGRPGHRPLRLIVAVQFESNSVEK